MSAECTIPPYIMSMPHPGISINGVVVTWVVAIDPPGVRFPLNAVWVHVGIGFTFFPVGIFKFLETCVCSDFRLVRLVTTSKH